MSPEEKKAVARECLLRVWDHRDFCALKQFTVEGYTYSHPGMSPLGVSALQDFIAVVHRAIPDLNNTIEEQIAEGDVVVTRGTTRGTHTGPWGEATATGNKIEVAWVMVTRFSANKIVSDWEIFDSLAMMQSLGVARTVASAAS